MLDINFIREHKDRVSDAIRNKHVSLSLDELFEADDARKALLKEVESLNRQRNEQADMVKKSGRKPTEAEIADGKKIKEQLATLEPKLREAEERFSNLMLMVPNIYAEGTPIGKDDTENVELRTWGTPKAFSFQAKDHIELGEKLNIIDTERGTKVAGFRGYFLKNDLALLHWALLTFAINKMAAKGFQVMITPSMINDIGLMGSGWFPAGKEEVYAVDDLYLSGTAEVPLLAYHADEVLDLSAMPLKYCGFSPCFRREAGSYGKDTKGLYRLHEFWKVEQVVLMENNVEASLAMFKEMLDIAEELLRDLELPYRVLQICTGDMGVGKYTMCDIETWMPSRNKYSETHSCSLLTDWQSRRLNIRYKDADGAIQYPYTLNNTVVASPRILIALLENYQNEDGSIDIPKVLQPLMGNKTRITAK